MQKLYLHPKIMHHKNPVLVENEQVVHISEATHLHLLATSELHQTWEKVSENG